MFVRVALACLLAAVPLVAQQEGQEKPAKPVPKDSIRVVIDGCVKGRVMRAGDVRKVDETASGLSIRSKTFRLEGKKDVMNGVKEVDGDRAEVIGLIKKTALIEPGMSVLGGRVRIGAGSTGGTASSLPDPAQDVVVLDVETVQAIGGTCDDKG